MHAEIVGFVPAMYSRGILQERGGGDLRQVVRFCNLTTAFGLNIDE
jgi:hypothetical protein